MRFYAGTRGSCGLILYIGLPVLTERMFHCLLRLRQNVKVGLVEEEFIRRLL
jgi:hypothetical protein